MLKKIIEMGYFWNGITGDVANAIKNCGICYSEGNVQILEKKKTIIITKGPNIRYKADIWYIPNQLKIGHEYLYIFDIIDHYSKWMFSFLLKNNEAELILSKIKLFINMNGNYQIFQPITVLNIIIDIWKFV